MHSSSLWFNVFHSGQIKLIFLSSALSFSFPVYFNLKIFYQNQLKKSLNLEAATVHVLQKKVFLKIMQNEQVQTPTQLFSCDTVVFLVFLFCLQDTSGRLLFPVQSDNFRTSLSVLYSCFCPIFADFEVLDAGGNKFLNTSSPVSIRRQF